MKKIFTYSELINEELLIKNRKLVESYTKEIKNEVMKAISPSDVEFFLEPPKATSDIVLFIYNLKESEIKYVEKIAKKWQNRLMENNISIRKFATDHKLKKSRIGKWMVKWKKLQTTGECKNTA